MLEFLRAPENAPLILAILFAGLWLRVPPNITYETLEMERVSTKKVMLILSLTCLGIWLLIQQLP